MDVFLLQLAAYLRPILYMDVGVERFFDIAAIIIFVLLLGAFLIRAAVEKDLRITSVDVWIMLFSIWCLTAYITYPDKANAREMVKLIIPFWTYVIAKNVLRSPNDYLRVLRMLIFGFVPPVLLSVALIGSGQGVELIDYWTGIPRWRGAYTGSHSLGHNMTFLLMVLMTYWGMRRIIPASSSEGKPLAFSRLAFWGYALLGMGALYCLYQSQVRTAVLGLLVFIIAFLFRFNRKLLLWLVVLSVVGVTAALPILVPRFFKDVVMVQKGEWSEEEIGSGRPRMWSNNLERFAEMPIDRQLAGVGIGNKEGIGGSEGITDSHNDFLDVFIQTGVVGFLLFLGIQGAFLKKILALERHERGVFLAIFISVMIMDFVSNSYVTRFGLAQMYFILLSYIEARRQSHAASVWLPVGVVGRGGG